MIEIVEPGDDFQYVIDGKLWVYCDCEYTDKCPQGKRIGSDRCIVPLRADRLSNAEYKRLTSPQR